MSSKPDSYLDKVPEDVDFTQQEWDDLSYDMQYYYANEKRQEYLKEKAKEVQDRNRKFNKSIKENNSCRNCGEEHYATLVWHHTGEKSADVAELVKNEYSIERVSEEMDMCVLICSNCHKKCHTGDLEVSSLKHGSDMVSERLK
jgi:hypothetical protein